MNTQAVASLESTPWSNFGRGVVLKVAASVTGVKRRRRVDNGEKLLSCRIFIGDLGAFE